MFFKEKHASLSRVKTIKQNCMVLFEKDFEYKVVTRFQAKVSTISPQPAPIARNGPPTPFIIPSFMGDKSETSSAK